MDIYSIFLRKAENIRDNHEREDAFVEEHMTGRGRPKSRNRADHGAPATWNEKKRIDQNDADMKTGVEADTDMSLNYKHAAKPKPAKEPKPAKNLEQKIAKVEDRLGKIGPKFAESFRSNEADKLLQLAKENPSKCSFLLNENLRTIEDASNSYLDLFKSSKKPSDAVLEAWRKSKNIYMKAGIVEALRKAAMASGLPNSVKFPLLRSRGNKISDMESIRSIVKEKKWKRGTRFPENEINRFVSMATAYKALLGNPGSLTSDQVMDKKTAKAIHDQMSAVSDLADITSEWTEAVSELDFKDADVVDVRKGEWGKVLGKIDSFMHSPKAPIEDPGKYMLAIAENIQSQYGEIPDTIAAMLKGYGAPLDDLKTSTHKDQEEEQKHQKKLDTQKKKDQEKEQKHQKKLDLRKKKDEEEVIKSVIKEMARKRSERDRKKKRQDEYMAEAQKREQEIRNLVNQEKKHSDMINSEEFVDEVLAKLEKTPEPLVKKQPSSSSSPKVGPAREEAHDFSKQDRPMSSISSSYEKVCRRMEKLATYHGMVGQGHPTDPPGSSPTIFDKRYLGKKHYDSIIASAKSLLKEDWLKYGWGENPSDVPMRAALDLAIHTADNGLYQSKIDAITYNMLLNRLAGWEFDIFNETLFAKRKASAMANPINNMLKIADDLRSTHPEISVQIVKNVHALSKLAADPAAQVDYEADRNAKEKELEAKLSGVLQDFGLQQGPDLSKLIDDILNGVENIKTASSLSQAMVLKAVIAVASKKPEHRGHLRTVIASIAAKKGKKDEKKPEKKSDKKSDKKDEKKSDKKDEKKPEKKSDKKDEKKKPKGRKASLDQDDINW